jgi:hypothetical protein
VLGRQDRQSIVWRPAKIGVPIEVTAFPRRLTPDVLLPSGGDETEEKREGCGIWDGPDFSIERAWVRILHLFTYEIPNGEVFTQVPQKHFLSSNAPSHDQEKPYLCFY